MNHSLRKPIPPYPQGSLVACMMGILQLMGEAHYTRLWTEHMASGVHQLRHLLHSTVVLLADLVRAAVFPSDWFVMRMVTNYTILVAMQEIAQPLIATFLKQGRFDNQVCEQTLCYIIISNAKYYSVGNAINLMS